MKRIILIAVVGIIAAGMVAAGSGTKAKGDMTQEQEKEAYTVSKVKHTTGNMLLDAQVYEADIVNGAGDEVIGTRGEISMNKADMRKVTNEEFKTFAETEVAGQGYNWFTIFFEDNTGICFEGALSYCATYGTVDTDGTIIEAEGMIVLGSDGEYTYTAVEE